MFAPRVSRLHTARIRMHGFHGTFRCRGAIHVGVTLCVCVTGVTD